MVAYNGVNQRIVSNGCGSAPIRVANECCGTDGHVASLVFVTVDTGRERIQTNRRMATDSSPQLNAWQS